MLISFIQGESWAQALFNAFPDYPSVTTTENTHTRTHTHICYGTVDISLTLVPTNFLICKNPGMIEGINCSNMGKHFPQF